MRTSEVVVVVVVVVGLKSWERIEMQPQFPIQSAVCNNYDPKPHQSESIDRICFFFAKKSLRKILLRNNNPVSVRAVVNFNILWQLFCQYSFAKKITKPNCN